MDSTRRQQYIDILTTGYEQGISYWLNSIDFKKRSVTRNDTGDVIAIRFTGCGAVDMDYDLQYLVDVERLDQVINKLSHYVIRPDLKKQLESIGTESFDVDADAADVLIQIACFGEIVYG